jgi:hypothetical protein
MSTLIGFELNGGGVLNQEELTFASYPLLISSASNPTVNLDSSPTPLVRRGERLQLLLTS